VWTYPTPAQLAAYLAALLVALALERMSSSTFDAVPAPDQVPRPDEPDVVAPAICGGSEAGAPRLAENSVEQSDGAGVIAADDVVAELLAPKGRLDDG